MMCNELNSAFLLVKYERMAGSDSFVNKKMELFQFFVFTFVWKEISQFFVYKPITLTACRSMVAVVIGLRHCLT